MSSPPASSSLDPAAARSILSALQPDAERNASVSPRNMGARQPVQTLYGGAHLFRADAVARLGATARAAVDREARTWQEFRDVFGGDEATARAVRSRVVAKLEREPIEDLRIDFEDGYGYRADDDEDADASRCGLALAEALAAGALPPVIGLRIAALTTARAQRAARTLDLLVTALARASGGRLPSPFVVTLPKVSSVAQPVALAQLCDALERSLGLAPASLGIELMVETPQALCDARGASPLRAMVEACAGRCTAVHLGAYDLTAACGVGAVDQTLDHPICDAARRAMQFALGDTGVHLADGATNVLPIAVHRGDALTEAQRLENRRAVHEGWRLHARNVRAAIAQGFHQSWDLHPAQLVSRYAAVYGYYAATLPGATARLRNFVDRAAQATRVGSVFDDAATGQGLLEFFARGRACGALGDDEVRAAGLTPDQLAARSFERIVRDRAVAQGRAP